MAPELTTDETRLVERYLWVLDLVGRCARAIDDDRPSWHYLMDKAGALAAAAGRLEEELARTGAKPKVRPAAVLAGVRFHGRTYRVPRLLHPISVELTPTEVGSILLDVAGADGLLAGEAELARIREDADKIAARTDLQADQVARVLAALASWTVRER